MAALAPPKVFEAACEVAAKKAAQPSHVTLVLGFSAGSLIGIGALLMTCVGACSPELMTSNPGLDAFLKGAVGLPAGLTLVVLTGAELFTSNAFTMLAGVLQGTAPALELARNWMLSYVGNFVGSIFLAWLSHSAHTLATEPALKTAQGIAHFKTSLPFGTLVAKGILCNWLVCLAVWGALASPSVSGKILAIFWPIMAFVTLGFEHCVANMFLIPQGILAGADISVEKFLVGNLVPVTVGNIIGATIFVAGLHFVAFGAQATANEQDSEDDESEDSCNVKPQRRTRGVDLEVKAPSLAEAGAARRIAAPPVAAGQEQPLYETVDMYRSRLASREGLASQQGRAQPLVGQFR